MKFRFKLFLVAMATLMVVSIGVFQIVTYQSGKREGLKEGEVYVQDGTEIYVAPEKDYLIIESGAEIKIAEEGEGLLLSKEQAVKEGLTVSFDLYTSVVLCDTEFGVHSILFYGDEDKIIGGLTWDEGVFVFKGRAKESAHQFFEHFLKALVDNYIEEQLEKEEYIGVEFVSKDYELDKSFLVRVTADGEEVGIVYFDKSGHIQFRGDRGKFERSMLKILKTRYGKEEK